MLLVKLKLAAINVVDHITLSMHTARTRVGQNKMERHPQDLEHPEVPDYSKLCNFVPRIAKLILTLLKAHQMKCKRP